MKMMKFVPVVCLVLLATAPLAAAQEKKPESLADRVSYGIGMNIGRDFKNQEIDVNPELVAQGIKDAVAGGETLMTEEEVKQTIAELQQIMQAKQQAKLEEMSAENAKAGEEFRAENAKKDGVKTLPSGLQYKVVEAGKGKSPKATDTVKVNYRGTLINGEEFDSSFKRGQPATFPLNGVIKGWTEALQLMKEGGKWQIVLPPELAYGERGAGPVIGPNSTLVFDVELLEIMPAEEKK